MNYLLNCFRFYIKLHCVVVVLWLVYLVLSLWDVINFTHLVMIAFLWLHTVFFILSILYIGYIYLIRRKKELIKLDIFLIVLCNTISLFMLIFDPFHMVGKILG